MKMGLCLLLVAILGGCKKENPAVNQPRFRFAVEEVFYIKPPVDRVILVGTVQEGIVHPGDGATVHCRTGPVCVMVEGIEGYKQGDLQQAEMGQQVRLRLTGISKEAAWKGDTVTGN